MGLSPCFSSSYVLSISIGTGGRLHTSSRARVVYRKNALCTLAPERVSKEKRYRILDDLRVGADSLPPSPPRYHSIPCFGFFLEKILGIPAWVSDKARTHGPIFVSNYLLREIVLVHDYTAVIEIFREAETFQSAPALAGIEALLPNTLLSMNGEKAHRKMRCHSTGIRSFVTTFLHGRCFAPCSRNLEQCIRSHE